MAGNTLVQFEHNFERRMNALEQTPWAILQVQLLDQMLRDIAVTFSGSERYSYFAELTPYIIRLFKSAESQIGNSDPAVLVRFLSHITNDHIFLQITNRGIRDEIVQSAIRIIARLYFRLHELQKFSRFLISRNITLPETPARPEKPVSREEYWETIRDQLPEYLQKALEQEQTRPAYHPDKLMGLFAVQWQDYRAGMLGEISIENIAIVNEKGADQIRIATHLVNESDLAADQTRNVRTYLRDRMSLSGKERLKLQYGIDQPVSLLTGDSVGLALSLLGEIGFRNIRRGLSWETGVNERVMFTGATDSRGNLTEIEDADIPVKIESAFFGPAHTVVLPKEHGSTARKAVEDLQQAYPNRHLEILPVEHMEHLFDDPKIVRSTKRSFWESTRLFLSKHVAMVSFLLILIFSAASLLLYENVIKKSPPAQIDVLQNRLAVKNSYGFILWESEPFGTRSKARQALETSRIIDLNGDGLQEILVCYDGSTIQGFRSSIVCYSAHGDNQWMRNINFPVQYNSKKVANLTKIDAIHISDFNGDGTKEIVSISQAQKNFPTRVLVLSWDGNPLADYWYAGTLGQSIVAADVYQGNQTKELVLCGTNAEYKSGVVLALDPFRTKGASGQTRPYYVSQDMGKGHEIFYIRFPGTPFQSKFTTDLTLLADSWNSGSFLVYLVNGVSREYFDGELDGGIYYKIGKDFHIDSIGVSERYDDLFEQAFPSENPVYNRRDLIDKYKMVEYYNGDVWVSEPAINRYYVESIAARELLIKH